MARGGALRSKGVARQIEESMRLAPFTGLVQEPTGQVPTAAEAAAATAAAAAAAAAAAGQIAEDEEAEREQPSRQREPASGEKSLDSDDADRGGDGCRRPCNNATVSAHLSAGVGYTLFT
jgi:hypothetical protein